MIKILQSAYVMATSLPHTQHVPSTNDHEWHAKEGDATPDSFVYWKGKHTFLERKAIKNTRPFLRLIEVEEKARVLEEQARIQ